MANSTSDVAVKKTKIYEALSRHHRAILEPLSSLTTYKTTKIAKTMNKKQLIKIILSVLIAALTALGAAFGLSSCNVVRTITNRSEFFQRGDTSVTIQTKTIESYDASKH